MQNYSWDGFGRDWHLIMQITPEMISLYITAEMESAEIDTCLCKIYLSVIKGTPKSKYKALVKVGWMNYHILYVLNLRKIVYANN